MKQPKKKPTLIKPVAAAEVPLWVTSTPEEITYTLEITEWATGNTYILETVHLNRREYIALKLYLAVMRGIEVPLEPHKDADNCGHQKRVFDVPAGAQNAA